MKTLVVYETGKGEILLTQSGEGEFPAEARSLITDVPDGYYVKSVNPKTAEAVFEKLPKTEAERITELEAQVNALLGTEEAVI